jgi:hypothetical protein
MVLRHIFCLKMVFMYLESDCSMGSFELIVHEQSLGVSTGAVGSFDSGKQQGHAA